METTINSIVEVFKTNVQDPAVALTLVRLLQKHINNSLVNFDLEDCDKILRIEGKDISHQLVTGILNKYGYLYELIE